MPAEMEKDARMRTENAGRDGLDAKTMSAGLLAAVCIGHFLNDGIGSIIPAALPILRDAHGLTFAEVGLITLVVPDHKFAAAALGRLCDRQAADPLRAFDRHVLHVRRAHFARDCGFAHDDTSLSRIDRLRLRRLSSRIRAHCPARLGRPQGLRAGRLSSRRQCRHGHRTARGRFCGRTLRQSEHCLFAPAAALAACLFIWVGRRASRIA